MSNQQPTQATTHEMRTSRTLDAPVESVWNAWTQPEQVVRWWGPTGFTSPLVEMDVREGGTSLVCMRSPDGHDLYNTWTYHKVVPLQRLEFVNRFTDRHRNQLDPAALGLPPGIPAEVPHVVTFEAVGDQRTELSVTEYGYGSQQAAELSRAGMEQVLDKLARSL
jgi:uncharacterized protein YndB with AHSA1/START domain